jgi:hypothetical protein
VVKRKRGHSVGLALGAELGNEIAERAVGKVESTCDLRQRLAIHEEGPQEFIAAMYKLARFEKEPSAKLLIHEPSSKCHPFY